MPTENKPAAQHQGRPAACAHEWTDDGEFLLVCTACGTQEDYTQALQLAFELGGTDDGSYHLEAEDLCEVIRRYVEQPAPVAVVMPDVDELAQIIRKVDGSHTLGAGSLAEAILEEVARLNGVKP